MNDPTNNLDDPLNDIVKDTVKDTIKDTINVNQQKILEILTVNPRITAKTLSDELGINERNIKKNIKSLKDSGHLTRIGSNKTGHWEVNMF